ncbi:MAG: thiolase family protein [Aeromicrobium sp.]
MSDAVILSAVRTPIGVAFKGTLRDTPAEDLATAVVAEALKRSGLDTSDVGDVILGEALYGGGDLARYAAVASGLTQVPGQAVNRHCASALTAIGNAAAQIRSGMERAIIAGGVMSASMGPALSWRVLGEETPRRRMPYAFPYTGPSDEDVTITTGFSTAQELGLSREDQDAWALRSHQRAVEAIAAGVFADEIIAVEGHDAGGRAIQFLADEGPRATTSPDRLAGLPPLHPEIPGFSITAGNSSQVNDGAAALMIADRALAAERGIEPLAEIVAWSSVAVHPARTGMGALDAITAALTRAGIDVNAVDLWEINEAFASVPLAACRTFGIDEAKVNIFGSGCSLGHPVAATGARMVTTLVHELSRRGGGLGVAAMCAGAGQGGSVVVRVG